MFGLACLPFHVTEILDGSGKSKVKNNDVKIVVSCNWDPSE